MDGKLNFSPEEQDYVFKKIKEIKDLFENSTAESTAVEKTLRASEKLQHLLQMERKERASHSQRHE